MSQKTPLMSILILNYNGIDLLKYPLFSINNQVFPYGEFETIVVDNDSRDGSVEYLKKHFPNIKIIINDKNYGTGGINVAIKHALGEYIFFLVNFDLELDKFCLKNLYEALISNKGKYVVAPLIHEFKDKKCHYNLPILSRSFYETFAYQDDLPKIYPVPTCASLLMKKTVMNELDYYFDPDFFLYSEDLDLGLRLRLIGYTILKVSDAVYYHMGSAVTKKYFSTVKLTFFNERNQIFTYLKICSAKSLIFFSPYVLIIRFLVVLKDIFTFKFRLALSRLKAYFWVLFNFRLIVKSRKKTQKTRKADDKFVFMLCDEKKFLKFLVFNKVW